MTAQSLSRLDILRDPAEFLALRDEWMAVENASRDATLFNTWGWLYPWWEVYGKPHRLFLLIARVEKRLVGILPLYIRVERLAGLRKLRVLRLLGSGGDTSPDYLGAITLPGYEEVFAAAATNRLREQGYEWDVAYLTDIPSPSKMLDAFCKPNAFGMGTMTRTIYNDIPIVALAKDWPNYLAQLGATHRAQLARRRRKLAALPSMRLAIWNNAERLDVIFDRLTMLHRMRWRDAPMHPAFVSPTYLNFHRKIIYNLFVEDRIRLYCLFDGDEIIAIYYCYKFKDTISYFQSGFNPNYAHLSPGLLTLAYAIEQAIAEGCKTFDLLKGDYGFKQLWSNAYRQTATVIVFKNNLKGWICRAYLDMWPNAKTVLKRLLGHQS